MPPYLMIDTRFHSYKASLSALSVPALFLKTSFRIPLLFHIQSPRVDLYRATLLSYNKFRTELHIHQSIRDFQSIMLYQPKHNVPYGPNSGGYSKFSNIILYHHSNSPLSLLLSLWRRDVFDSDTFYGNNRDWIHYHQPTSPLESLTEAF